MNGNSPRDIREDTPGEGAEPVRLLACAGRAYPRRLLESADLDVMPSATPERLARALAEPGVQRLQTRRWARLGSIGGLGGLGLVAVLLAGRPSSLPEQTPSVSRA